jgi:hypothetical protein
MEYAMMKQAQAAKITRSSRVTVRKVTKHAALAT